MKLLAVLLSGLSCFLYRPALAAPPPSGSVLELHSCELYAGGCVVSSEATLGGRYMLRAWNFNHGSFAGADLSGLNLAVLQASPDNLAASGSVAGSVMVYLPQHATKAQRQALLAWLRSAQAGLHASPALQTRIVPIQFSRTEAGYALRVGHFASVDTAPLETCRTGACGDALWYTPRAETSVFTVALDQCSKVNEPLLQLKWQDSGRRTVFLGKFGQDTPARSLYVSSNELCGPAAKLF